MLQATREGAGSSAQAPSSAPRKRLHRDERRQQIIQTTLLCLARHGAEGTTLRSVCREMGVAPSLITHFFASWHDLLVAAYDTLVEQFMAELSQVVNAPYPSARKRMDAVIKTYLSTDWAGESSIGASVALWQLSRSVVDLRAGFSRYLAGRRRLLQRALRALATERGVQLNVAQLTASFMLMLDGVWLEISLNPGGVVERRTRQMCWFWLDGVMAGAVRSAPAQTPD